MNSFSMIVGKNDELVNMRHGMVQTGHTEQSPVFVPVFYSSLMGVFVDLFALKKGPEKTGIADREEGKPLKGKEKRCKQQKLIVRLEYNRIALN